MRRLLTTARPALVATRARKPCTAALWRVCGWNVLFGISVPVYLNYPYLASQDLNIFKLYCLAYKSCPLNHPLFPHIN